MEGNHCLELLVDGDREGLACLYKLFSSQLYKYGLSICGSDNEVSECLHDLFVYLWENRSNLSNIKKPKSYLFTSFKRRLIRQISNKNNIETFDIKYEHKFLETNTEERLIENEDKEDYLMRLNRALNSLSDREREAINLKYFQRYKNEEIAEILEINNQSVRNLLYRAIQNLRKEL